MIEDHYAEPPETLTFRIAGQDVEYRRTRRRPIVMWVCLAILAATFVVGCVAEFPITFPKG
jgi:hypothetical protein